MTDDIINTILTKFQQYLKDREEGILSDDEYYEYENKINLGSSPNDQNSIFMNQNNPAHQANLDNRANQLNTEHTAYRSSRGGKKR